jgi:hypothetical protein
LTVLGVTFTNDDQDISLRDVLEVLGRRGTLSTWQLKFVEAIGASAPVDALHSFDEQGARMPGRVLVAYANTTPLQIIDGEFLGFDDGAKRPWVLIRAVDGRWWDVQTDETDVLRRCASRFSDVSELPA